MKASIIQIGNSQGLRIPKPILKQRGFDGEVELEEWPNRVKLDKMVKIRKTGRLDIA